MSSTNTGGTRRLLTCVHWYSGDAAWDVNTLILGRDGQVSRSVQSAFRGMNSLS